MNNPKPSEIIAFRVALQNRHDIGITAAQRMCATALHTSLRAFQQWEHGDRRMHASFWELLTIKGEKISETC